MLRRLHIRGFVTVEQLALELGERMTVFTGETGAGKSILVEALGLVLGDRAQGGLVRSGCERAAITAVFDLRDAPEVGPRLAEKGIDRADGECIIKRQIDADGRSRGFINGDPVTAQVLREIGESLVDIHGQNAHQSLLRRDVQRGLLDDFAGHREELAATAAASRAWKAATDELDRLGAQSDLDREAEIDLLRYQIQELEALRITPEALAALEQDHTRLSNAARIVEACRRAAGMLHEDAGSADSLIGRASREIQALHQIDPALEPITLLLDQARVHLAEACPELRHYLAGVDMDPDRLERVEAKLSALHDLARKHRVAFAELPGHLAALQTRAHHLENSRARERELRAAQAARLTEYQQAAQALHASRVRAAGAMSEEIARHIRELGMPGGMFSVHVEAVAGDLASPHGIDRVEFLVTTNPGEPPRPLGKVASGGELSRISLAIQVVNASDRGVPTLVFDEVDVGIGGAVAEIVGRRLQCLGEKRQVLCVTHLPQVASVSDQHLKVIKTTDDQTTRTRVDRLEGPDRVQEIARMLGGITISRQTINHAREMLRRASPETVH